MLVVGANDFHASAEQKTMERTFAEIGRMYRKIKTLTYATGKGPRKTITLL